LFLGYYLSKIFRLDNKQCKTISLEVGLQNSALASALAILHFNPLSALPGAIYSIWYNISGSFIATRWSKKT
jgi:BASS family bile acid:Na+ symporter